MDSVKLLNILDALIDTAERTTDLENVYNDTIGDLFSWHEVYTIREAFADTLFTPEGKRNEQS